MSPTDGFISNVEAFSTSDLEIGISSLRVPLSELIKTLDELMIQGFTEILLQNPQTNERVCVALEDLQKYCLVAVK